jgi:hypothetical protein
MCYPVPPVGKFSLLVLSVWLERRRRASVPFSVATELSRWGFILRMKSPSPRPVGQVGELLLDPLTEDWDVRGGPP